jgi:hypothetical protein
MSKFNKFLEKTYPKIDTEYYYVSPIDGVAWIIINKSHKGVRISSYSKTGESWIDHKIIIENYKRFDESRFDDPNKINAINFVIMPKDVYSKGYNREDNVGSINSSINGYKATKEVFEQTLKEWGFTI